MKHILLKIFNQYLLKITITNIFILSFFATSAQNKDFDNLKNLYQTAKYDKCIEKSNDIATKYPKSPLPNYYSSFSYFEKFKISQINQKRIILQSTLNSLKIAYSKDKDSLFKTIFLNQSQEIKDTTLKYAEKFWNEDKKDIAGIFYKYLAEIFRDTTVRYIELFEPQKILPKQQLSYSEYTGLLNQTDFEGRKQGVWIEKYPNGVVKSEIFYKDGKPAGIFNKYYENGNPKSKMVFDEKSIYCSAILYNPQGQKVAMGYYYNKQKDSLWQYFYNDTIVVAEESYKKGVKNGFERNYSTFGPIVLEEKFYKNGKLDSTWTRYTIEGKKKFVARYKNDQRTGIYELYDENGKVIIQGKYKYNVPQGTWKYWNEKTGKYTQIEYVDGVPKNLDKLTEEENNVFKQMDQMQGKIEEPADYIKKTYQQND